MKKKEEIRVQVEKVYDIFIPNDDVLYDPVDYGKDKQGIERDTETENVTTE